MISGTRPVRFDLSKHQPIEYLPAPTIRIGASRPISARLYSNPPYVQKETVLAMHHRNRADHDDDQ